jgi:hypothetical protein
MIRHLISLVLESLYNLDMIIRKDILTKLRKDGFKYYYVVNEKDIEFSEDDKQGWIKTWVTLGRLREDKQLDCVTIGCYRDNILLVETGVRKNPDMNLSDTENKEWWTKCDAKNFSVKTSRENKTLTTEVAFFDEGEIERFAVMTAHLTPYEKFTTEIIKVYNPVYQDYNALTLISELAPFEKSAPKLKYLSFIRSDGNSDVKLFVNKGVGEEQEHFLLTANVIKMMLDKENNKKWQKD